jgi:ubiquinone/menaquinone biosynthesis C-methylase UbiE
MPNQQPHTEHPSTYFVEDRSNQEELARLQVLDAMLTADMGGVLPEQPDSAAFARVLDVGCGTGGWLIEVAKSYPSVKVLIGIDISQTFVEYARTQAEAAQVSDRVEFQVMDALRMLEFPRNFFDLVNQRGGMSWLRTWDWRKLLEEYQRVCRPGGVIRIVEGAWWESNSPALECHSRLFIQALHRAGYFFTPTNDGLSSKLVHLLQQHGLRQVQTKLSSRTYRPGTPEWQRFAENVRLTFRTGLPFLHKWTRVPEDYEQICGQALSEMQQPNFVATWNLLTAWGTVPSRRERSAGTLWGDRS